MNIPYMYQQLSEDSLEIDDLGNVCIQAFNDVGEEYNLSITTSLGWSSIEEFGPLQADMNSFPNYFSYTYYRIEYREAKLYKVIHNFLNNPKRNITQAFFTDYETFEQRIRSAHKQE